MGQRSLGTTARILAQKMAIADSSKITSRWNKGTSATARHGAMNRKRLGKKVTHLLVHGFGVLDPEMLLVTFTLGPDGMKFTLPGPSVTLVYEAATFADEIPSMTKIGRAHV